MEFKDKTVVVTGAGRGIGEGIAVAFGREGANVVVADLNLENAQAVVGKVDAAGGKGLAFKANVTSKADVDAMAAAAVKQFGGIDVLVNNAGIEAPPTLFQDMTEAQFDRVLGVNLKGVFLCTQAVLPAMIARGKGRIVNIGSIAGIRMSFFGGPDYTASKHGVSGMSHHLAWELAEHHITVNVVCPGGVVTPLMEKGTSQELRDKVTNRLVPLGRMCSLDDIAQPVLFFASDKAALITGQVLAVDGGLLTGYGEDIRPLFKQRVEAAKKGGHV